MDLNFRGTKLSQIENFTFSHFYFCGCTSHNIEYIDYISVLICASHISHTKPVQAARGV